jgi:hypothetical protein
MLYCDFCNTLYHTDCLDPLRYSSFWRCWSCPNCNESNRL